MIRTDAPSRKTVAKAMRILHAFTRQQPELSIGELAERLSLHKSDVSRLVAVLREWRMIEKDPHSQRLRVGEGAFRVGSLYSQNDDVSRVAKAHMNGLVVETGHSAHVTVLDGDRVLVVATVESPNALRVIMRLGEHRALHSTASGKIFLAYSDDLLARVTARPLDAFTPGTIATATGLKAALRKVRSEGLAWNRGENSAGAGAVAAPIFDSGGQMTAALSTVFPLHVVDNATRRRIAAATVEAAGRISQQLGYRDTPERSTDGHQLERARG